RCVRRLGPVTASRPAAAMSTLLIVISVRPGGRWEDPEDKFRILPIRQIASASWLSVIALLHRRRGVLIGPDLHNDPSDCPRKGVLASEVIVADGRAGVLAAGQAVAGKPVSEGYGDRNFPRAHLFAVEEQFACSGSALAYL